MENRHILAAAATFAAAALGVLATTSVLVLLLVDVVQAYSGPRLRLVRQAFAR